MNSSGHYFEKLMKKEDLINFLVEKKFIPLKQKYNQCILDDAFHKNDDRNELREDFYAVTFLSYVFVDDRQEIDGVENWDDYRGKTIRENELSRNFMNCLFIFIMQLSLTGITVMFLSQATNDADAQSKKDPTLQYATYILITRFVCAIILNLQIEPEICQSINLMRFALNRTGS